MIHTFHIDDSNPMAKAFIEFVKTLDFVKKENEIDVPKWQQEVTLKRLKDISLKQNGTVDFDGMLNDLEEKYGL